jgi:hypothetical protein
LCSARAAFAWHQKRDFCSCTPAVSLAVGTVAQSHAQLPTCRPAPAAA